jgi:asparagine synthase (glutamine-hydrolysing)
VAALAEAKMAYPGEPIRQAMYADQLTFLCSLLDRNDRMTMGASIECRVPFLDFRLVEGVAALPTRQLLAHGRSKPLLRDAIGHRLPGDVLRGRKWGFGVPWGQHLRREPALREVVASLPTARTVADGPADRGAVARVVRAFLAGDVRQDALVRQLAMIELWHRACIVDRPRPTGRATLVTA